MARRLWTISTLCLAVACTSDSTFTPEPEPEPTPGLDSIDADEDGSTADVDCNDTNAEIFPGAVEVCNGTDDDCNGEVDEGLYATFYRDADGDGFGDAEVTAHACAAPGGFVANADDCDDYDSDVHPDGVELCDIMEIDEDCDGLSNDDDPDVADIATWYVDADEDGYGDPKKPVERCFDEPGLATWGTDCDDTNPGINPAELEVCDPDDVDEDCDGFADAADPEGPDGHVLHYWDGDGDGWGDETDPGQYFCDGVPDGHVPDNTDCDDTDDRIGLDAPEHCTDGIDNDCNGGVDDCGPIDDIALSDADITIEGSEDYGYIGQTVADLGDMDGDGWSDFALGGYAGGSYEGRSYIFYGPISAGSYETDDLAEGLLTGDGAYSYFGYAVDGAGDVDGDGYDDILASRYYNPGEVYLLLGPIYGDLEVDTYADTTWKEEASSDYLGYSVGGDFDHDGDGVPDTIMGAPYHDNGGTYNTGVAYIEYGEQYGTQYTSSADLTITSSTSYDYLGMSVAALGDMDGDGIDEAAIGGYGSSSYTGKMWILAGGSGLSGHQSASSIADATITGASSSNYLGYDVSPGGDYNDDGYADVLVNAYYADTGGSNTGSVYVITGPPGSGSVNSVAHAELYGELNNDQAGRKNDGAMDVNRDGYTDVLVGVYQHEEPGTGVSNVGSTYLVYGPASGDISLANARVNMMGTVNNEQSGWDVAFIGDQDGDDVVDILIGAPYRSGGGTYRGGGYIISGDRL